MFKVNGFGCVSGLGGYHASFSTTILWFSGDLGTWFLLNAQVKPSCEPSIRVPLLTGQPLYCLMCVQSHGKLILNI